MLRFAATADGASGGDGPEVGRPPGEEVSIDIRALRITLALTVALAAGDERDDEAFEWTSIATESDNVKG